MESKFSIAHKDEAMMKLLEKADHKILAEWAIDCAERVIPYFEKKYPKDDRPRNAIKTLQKWIDTGIFKMAVIRKASLDSHAAAREVGEDNPARSAARAAGQAVATAHVPHHSYGAAIYAQQAVFRASQSSDASSAVAAAAATTAVGGGASTAAASKERNWQYHRLLKLTKGRVWNRVK